MKRRHSVDTHDTTCGNCGEVFQQSDYGDLCNAIQGHKPSCSFECNNALGQVDQDQIRHNAARNSRIKERS